MTRRVKVIPRSAKSEIAGEMANGTLKVKIEKGKANEALSRSSQNTTVFHEAPSPWSADTQRC